MGRKLDYAKIRLQIDPRKPTGNADVITDIVIHMKKLLDFDWLRAGRAKSVTVQTTNRNSGL